MTVTNVSQLAQFAELAMASYANLENTNYQSSLMDVGMAKLQASAFLEKYEIVSQIDDRGTGFSATVFKDKNSKKITFAVRGTQPGDFANDLLIADFGQIGPDGYARSQAASMYRYWRKLTTAAGESVAYSEAEIQKLYAINTALRDGSGRGYLVFRSEVLADKGIDEGQGLGNAVLNSNSIVNIAGHSLGGHLAMLFARFFPENTDEVVTVNAPGFFPGSEVLSLLGFQDINEASITRVQGQADLVSTLGTIKPGVAVSIAQETYLGAPIVHLLDHHSIKNSSDALMLMNIIAALDKNKSSDVNGLSDLVRATSETPENTYEKLLDDLRKLFVGPDIVDTEIDKDKFTRDKFYENVQQLLSSDRYKSAVGKSEISYLSTLTTASLASFASAEAGSAYRYALVESNPWALLGVDYSNMQGIDIYDATSGKGALTEKWIAARSEYLYSLIQSSIADKQKTADLTTLFGDKNSQILSLSAESQYSEGSIYAGAGNDTLYGGAGQDYLEGGDGADEIHASGQGDLLLGMEGDDSLISGAGDDELDGGLGFDTYRLYGGSGRDIIRDVDGKGQLIIEGVTLTDLEKISPSSYAWRSKDGSVDVYYSGYNLSSGGSLTISYSATDYVIIENFKNGMLGLTLPTEIPSQSIDVPDRMISGDIALNPDDPTFDDYGNIAGVPHSAPNQDDMLTGGNERAAIYGYGGNDTIAAGQGGAYIVGGEGTNFIFGSHTNDTIFLNDEVTIDEIQLEKKLTSSRPIGFATGGSGDDLLVGSASSDVLLGSFDQDTIYGRGGDDYISGDDYIVWGGAGPGANYNPNFYWSKEDYKYGLTVDLGSVSIPSVGSNDILYGGDGNDIVLGGSGDDLLFGDEGDDLLVGDSGNDTLYGGAGNDFLQATARGESYAGTLNYLYGDDGDDTLLGDVGTDFLSGGDGNDLIYGEKDLDEGNGGDNDVIFGGKGQDTIYGRDGSDNISGGEGDDNVYGGIGNDALGGDDGNDSLYGGAGQDTITGGEGADLLSGEAGDDYLFGGDGDDSIWGGEGKDSIYGGNGVDSLQGGDGDDFMSGGLGQDTLWGDAGNDTLIGGEGRDILVGGEGNDTYFMSNGDLAYDINGASSVFLDIPFDKERLRVYRGDAQNTYLVLGDNVINSFRGDVDSFQLYFDDGETVSLRRLSVDFAYQSGNDVEADNSKYGTQFAERMNGNDADNFFMPGAGNDTIYGYGGADELSFRVGDGNDVVDQDSGSLVLNFEAALDESYSFLHLQNGDLKIGLGTNDSVTVTGFYDRPDLNVVARFSNQQSVFSDQLRELPVQIIGTAGSDRLVGTASNEVILGLAGDDSIGGFGGNDTLKGGAGDDTYQFDYGSAGLLIEDVEGLSSLDIGQADKTDLHGRIEGDDLLLWLGDGSATAKILSYVGREDSWFVKKAGGGASLLKDVLQHNEEASSSSSSGDRFLEMYLSKSYYGFSKNLAEVGLSERDGDLKLGSISNEKSIYNYSSYESTYGEVPSDYESTYNGMGGSYVTINKEIDINAVGEWQGKVDVGAINNYPNIHYYRAGVSWSPVSVNRTTSTAYQQAYRWVEVPAWEDDPEVTTTSSGVQYLKLFDGLQPAYDVSRISFRKEGTLVSPVLIEPESSSEGVKLSEDQSSAIVQTSLKGVGRNLIRITGGEDKDNIILDEDDYRINGQNRKSSDDIHDDFVILGAAGDDTIAFTWGYYDAWTALAGDPWSYNQGLGAYLDGGEGNDVIVGSTYSDYIRGGDGQDTLNGAGGSDLYLVSASDFSDHELILDTGLSLFEGPYLSGSTDTVLFDRDVDRSSLTYRRSWIVAEGNIFYGYDVVNGSAEAISIMTTSGPNQRYMPGYSGWTGFGVEKVRFSDGVELSSDNLWELATQGENGVYVGGGEYFEVDAGDGGDLVLAGAGVALIHGGSGDDALFGGSSYTEIYGDEGNDTIVGGLAANYLYGGTGNDSIEMGGIYDNEEAYRYANGGDGADTLVGSSGWNHIYGGQGDDVISGSDNSGSVVESHIYGEEGSDLLQSGYGSSYIYGGGGNDIIYGNRGNYSELYGDDGDDLIYGGDLVEGGSGNDTIYGGYYSTILKGGDGADNITGGQDYSEIYGDSGDDTLSGGSGANYLYGGEGSDVLTMGASESYQYGDGGVGNDKLVGGGGWNYLHGGVGSDTLIAGNNYNELYGGEGDDNLFASTGYDVLSGGVGNDRYNLSIGGGIDIIDNTDHLEADVDIVALDSSDDIYKLWFSMDGSDLKIARLGTNDEIHLKGWYAEGTDNKVSRFEVGESHVLYANQVENLVNAMASFNSSGDASSPNYIAERQNLDAVIAANWT